MTDQIKLQFAENGLNAELFYKNTDPKVYSSLVPCSAKTGEGLPDLMMMLIGLIQKFMKKNITFKDIVEASVLEVRQLEGVGTTLDTILSNGTINVSDNILVSTLNGPVRTKIKRIYTPKPQKEIRVKCELDSHKTISASIGVKIYADNLNGTIAGTNIIVINEMSEEEIQKHENEMKNEITKIQEYKKDVGIYVQTPSLGSIEALINLLDQHQIPISGMNIGPINKKDIIRIAPMQEKDDKYCCILAFDVDVANDKVQKFADEMKIKIIHDQTIYRLVDKYKLFINEIESKKLELEKKEKRKDLVLPCKLKIIPRYIFRKNNPIIFGVEIIEGILKTGTKLCVKKETELFTVGTVSSIEYNKKTVTEGKVGSEVCIKIDPNNSHVEYDKQFNCSDILYSQLNERNMDALYVFKDEYGLDQDNIDKFYRELHN